MSLIPTDGLLVYTDGSYCNKGPGGWAWVAVDALGGVQHDAGYLPPPTTNNRMELLAPIEALKSLHRDYGPCEIQVVSDSAYVVGGFNGSGGEPWLALWKASDWKSGSIKNVELWKELELAVQLHAYVEWRHIRGHVGIKYNELADALAVEARRKGGKINGKNLN